jgi:hypothetical protein
VESEQWSDEHGIAAQDGSPEAKNRAALLDVAEQISTRLVNGVA